MTSLHVCPNIIVHCEFLLLDGVLPIRFLVSAMSFDRFAESYEKVLDGVLASWTALDLAVGHYDGPIRDAQEKRIVLLESISDAVRQEKYELNDIAEFINDYMYENFSMELDDNSQFDVARVCMEAWAVCKEGRIPQIPGRRSGATCSVVHDLAVEVDEDGEDVEDVDMADGSRPHAPHPKTVTDEDGWTTVIPKQH